MPMIMNEVSYHDDCGTVDALYAETECNDLEWYEEPNERDTIPCPGMWVDDGSPRLLVSEQVLEDEYGQEHVMRVDGESDEPLSVYLDRRWPESIAK
jgi:hypothetical protein